MFEGVFVFYFFLLLSFLARLLWRFFFHFFLIFPQNFCFLHPILIFLQKVWGFLKGVFLDVFSFKSFFRRGLLVVFLLFLGLVLL